MLQFGILASACVFFLAGLGGIIFPSFKKKMQNVPFIPLSWVSALFLVSSVLLAEFTLSFLTPMVIPFDFKSLFFVIGLGLLVMPLFYRRALKYQTLFVWSLCFLGTFFLPITDEAPLNLIGMRFLISIGWVLFILIYTELDRVPLEGFILNISHLLMFLLLSSPVFAFMPVELFGIYSLVLVLILLVLLLFKKNGLLMLGFPLIFMFTYFSGYGLIWLMFKTGCYCFILAVAYPLTEFLFAGGLNIYRFHKVFPIEVSFLSEMALCRGISAKKVFRSIFYTMVLTGCIAVISVNNQSIRFQLASLFMAGVILYNLYAGFFQKHTKVPLKNLGKDVKDGLKSFVQEIKSVPFKETVQKSKKPIQVRRKRK